MKTIIFTEDFAGRKSGEEWTCDSMLASDLIKRKVAKLKGEEKPKRKPRKSSEKA